MATKKKINDLIPDDKNFNKGSLIGSALLEKSIEKFGFREAATIDKNGKIIGGNKRTETAGALGFKDVEIIKADPNKIYALQFDDIDLDTPKGRELALALNQTASKNIVIDAEVVEAELGEAICEEWHVPVTNNDEEEEEDDKYFKLSYKVEVIFDKASEKTAFIQELANRGIKFKAE